MKVKLNKNEEIVKNIKEGLAKSGVYCPCRVEHTPDTKCMCKEFRDQAEGICHCGLYIKVKE